MSQRRIFGIVLSLLLLANLSPLASKYLPFTDLQGHVGLIGALAHWGDPSARIEQLYRLNLRPMPSLLFEGMGALLSHVMPVPAYTNLFLAVFCVAGLPLSLLYLLHAYGRDVRLALLIFPIIYYRCMWFGFANYVASVPLVLLGLGLLRRALDQPGWRGARRETVLLSLVCVLMVAAHFFGALVFYGLALIVLALERPKAATGARVLAALVPGLIYLVPWLAKANQQRNLGVLPAILHARRSARGLALLFYDWCINGVYTHLSDVVMAGAALSVVGAALYGLRHRAPVKAAAREIWQPLGLLGATALMFVVIPKNLPGWWGVNIRLVPFIWAFALLAIPPARRPTPAWVLAPGVLAGLAWGAYLGWDFATWYNRVELAGFDQALDEIPPGRMVLALWPEFTDENHYTHFPMADLADHYVVRHGGVAEPMLGGEEDMLIRPRPRPPSPPWGIAKLFSYRCCSRGWDYFLVKRPVPGRPPLTPLFGDAPPGAVSLVGEHGLWRVYKNNQP